MSAQVRFIKRFESSIDAFRISVRRALEFLETFESYVLEGKVLNSASFQKAMRFLAREDEEDDATPNSLSEQLDAHTEARQFIETLPTLNAELYDLKRLHNDLRRDVNALREIRHDIELRSIATCIVGLTLAVNLCNVRSTCDPHPQSFSPSKQWLQFLDRLPGGLGSEELWLHHRPQPQGQAIEQRIGEDKRERA